MAEPSSKRVRGNSDNASSMNLTVDWQKLETRTTQEARVVGGQELAHASRSFVHVRDRMGRLLDPKFDLWITAENGGRDMIVHVRLPKVGCGMLDQFKFSIRC